MFAIMPGRTLPTVDRQAGARLLQTRRLIASAQAASDDFDYAESNEILDQALTIIEKGDEHLRSSFALPEPILSGH